jgi:alpha-amylase/alpha-mannosidase (GH57 family)
MAKIRLVVLWHMHQPFYKDLVTGEYRLPWVRLHALKDYYGMVKLLDEFPAVRQTFNLVPSLIVQIEEYASGQARDPWLELAAKPAPQLTAEEKRFALTYFFQANETNLIGRYPRYRELWDKLRAAENSPERAAGYFTNQDFTDLQVLSQLAWFDEFFLAEPEVAALVAKGRGFSEADQKLVMARQREIVAKVLPAYAKAAQQGRIEISTSPFYHPILPLLCDTDAGSASSPGLKLPQKRFLHPEDARLQLERGLELHEKIFGMRPKGAWPSEGSLSEAVLSIAHELGLEWMATDEGVLGRSLGCNFARDGNGMLAGDAAQRLYRPYRYRKGAAEIGLVFRDHVLSDLIGFVYAAMEPQAAAANFLGKVKAAARPVLAAGQDAVVTIILDGENAWEYYARSGREFLRYLYHGIEADPEIAAVTVSEALRGEGGKGSAAATKPLERIVPGSWINANFNVWIGAPEDNRAWDYLTDARDFYANQGAKAPAEKRALALEEIQIAEGSDWNWWYGPEHHSANDRDFDELYRKHLTNIYLALNARPPDYLAQPIAAEAVRPTFVPQMAYIHPRIGAQYEGYFDWIGAALYTADRRSGSMHGKQFLLDSIHAGIDEERLYGRLDFVTMPEGEFEIRAGVECSGGKTRDGVVAPTAHVLEVQVRDGQVSGWKLRRTGTLTAIRTMDPTRPLDVEVSLRTNFAFSVLRKVVGCTAGVARLRFGLWRDQLPLDALPLEGWLELRMVGEDEMDEALLAYSRRS